MLVLSIYEAKTGALDKTTLPRVPVVLTPWIVVALVHCAIWPLVGVPTFNTLPPLAVEVIVIAPEAFVMLIPEPAVSWLTV